MTSISVAAAYRAWAATYDSDPNPLLALEERVLRERLVLRPGDRVVDVGTGTGRWLEFALSRGARIAGVDLSREMLAQAAVKCGIGARLIRADLCKLPLANNCADLVLASFVLSYVDRLDAAFQELARIAPMVVTSDLHPEAERAGWSRRFSDGCDSYEIAHWRHLRESLDDCARRAKLRRRWRLEAMFGEPERHIFEAAGKHRAFVETRGVPAVLITAWERT